MSQVFTIPPNEPFLPALARGLIAQLGEDLADALVLLPSRRAVLGLRDAFSKVTDGEPMLLPAMHAIGEVEPDELTPLDAFPTLIPPAIDPLRRLLLLARLVLAKGGVTHEKAMRLAGELARFLDEIQTEQVDPTSLTKLVPDDYAAHWQQVMAFLGIVVEAWPSLLVEEGRVDPADRRNRLLSVVAEAWKRTPPNRPIIAAGITGTVPAVGQLLDIVVGLSEGQLILPGLDQTMEEADWQAVGTLPVHPQFGLHRLLATVGVERHAVSLWPWASKASSRVDLLGEVMRPAGMTEAWQELTKPESAAYETLQVAQTSNTAHEALLLALQVRAALEEPEKRIAIVTSDRSLARRCAAELARWEIVVDDSSGTPLDQTPPGSFLLLAAHAVIDGFRPVPLLSLLKHPLCRGGLDQGSLRLAVRRLERLALRGPRLAAGIGTLKQAVAEQEDSAELRVWLDRFELATKPLSDLVQQDEVPLLSLIDVHLEIAEWLAADVDGDAGELWAKEAGASAARFMAGLRAAAIDFPDLPAAAYPAILAVLMAGDTVRPRAPRHPRVSVLGQLEARLLDADLLLIGGLNEGFWPKPPEPSPWLNRRLRHDLGLPPPELQIGIAAHDFMMAAAAPEVVLSRAQKDSAGTPTTPSRWLARLQAVATATGIADDLPLDPSWLQWAAELDQPDGPPHPIQPPEPKPPSAVRPRRFSVTDVEQLIRDPYGLYARRILNLRKLDPIDADPGYAERGVIIHKALETFVRAYPDALPDEPLSKLREIGRSVLWQQAHFPQVLAVWWPRFEAIAEWFIEQEQKRRANLQHIRTEAEGLLELRTPAGPFVIRARADRVELSTTGRLSLVDYKTGSAPSASHVRAGIAPQLPLSAAIAAAGGFGDGAGIEIDEINYWVLKGGEIGGDIKDPTFARGREVRSTMDLAAEARDGIVRLVTYFDDPATPYRAVPRPEIAPAYSDYDHLARIDEWRGSETAE